MDSNLAQSGLTDLSEAQSNPDLKSNIQISSPLAGSPSFEIANSDHFAATRLDPSPSSSTFSLPTKEMLILASILAILQVADGVLTGVGVYHMGIDMEANPLLRLLMGVFGTAPTLIAVKTLAISVIIILASLSGVVPWITIAFRGMVALYALVAVLPWSAILYGYFSA